MINMDTLLAQPAGDMRPADAEVKKDYWPEKRKVLQRINQLKQERLRWEDQWIDIRNYQLFKIATLGYCLRKVI